MKSPLFATLTLGIFTLLSFSTNVHATDCTFRITQKSEQFECETTLGRNCYVIPSVIFDEVAHVLNLKGYDIEVSDPSVPVGLEINLELATEYIVSTRPSWRLVRPRMGEGFVGIAYSDNNRGIHDSALRRTGVIKRKRLPKHIAKFEKAIPEIVDSAVRSCH